MVMGTGRESRMRDASAETAKKTGQKTVVAKCGAKDVAKNGAENGAKDHAKETALDRRYGAIGISAVAAAARYQGAAKNPAYAPVVNARYEPADEAA
jgi:hypothetical protein